MYKTSSNFRVSYFRNRVLAWIMFIALCFSFVPSISLAQRPIAMIKTSSGDVLVSGQAATGGTVLQAGDTIQTQAGASVVLELSDGSELHLSENTQITLTDLAQTSTGARISRVKLLWGRIRAFLSPQHQIEGSSFDIETPNALIGVKFSEPDIEVSYSLEKAETVGIAHTVELLAKNLLTDEEVLVPVGSTVIVVGMMMKVIAGTTAAAIATGTETATTGTATGVGTSTKVAIGVGAAAAAGGVAALAASSGDGSESETAESTGDLSGNWHFSGSCVAQGCTEEAICSGDPGCCGINFCNCCNTGSNKIEGNSMFVSQTGNILSGQGGSTPSGPVTLNGVVNGSSVSFTIQPDVIIPIWHPANTYTGVIEGNTIRGDFFGSGPTLTTNGEHLLLTWSGTFMVTIRK